MDPAAFSLPATKRPVPHLIDFNEIPSKPRDTLSPDIATPEPPPEPPPEFPAEDIYSLVCRIHRRLPTNDRLAAESPGEAGVGLKLPCGICGVPEKRGETMVCDGCERGFHVRCTRYSLRQQRMESEKEDWLCDECSLNGVPKKRWTLGAVKLPDIIASPPSEDEGDDDEQLGVRKADGYYRLIENAFSGAIAKDSTPNIVHPMNMFTPGNITVTMGKMTNSEDSPHHGADTTSGCEGPLLNSSIRSRYPVNSATVSNHSQGNNSLCSLRDFVAQKGGCLCDGWHVEFKQFANSSDSYAIYCAPDGRRFDSVFDVVRHLGLTSNVQSIEIERWGDGSGLVHGSLPSRRRKRDFSRISTSETSSKNLDRIMSNFVGEHSSDTKILDPQFSGVRSASTVANNFTDEKCGSNSQSLPIWEFICRFGELLGLKDHLNLDKFEEELVDPWPCVPHNLSLSEKHSLDSREGISQAIGSAVGSLFTRESYESCDRDSPFTFIETSALREAAQAMLATRTYGRCTGLGLTKIHTSLLKVLVGELLHKVAVYVNPNFDARESKPRCGRKMDADNSHIKDAKFETLTFNEFAWPELARRYVLAVSSMNGCMDSSESHGGEVAKVFRCLQDDGGIFCGSLSGIDAMESDALLLAEAERQISDSTKHDGRVLQVDFKDSEAEGECEQNIDTVGALPEWAQPLEPVRKLPTNVGTRIRRCIYNALEKDPPEWAKEVLQHSISKEVYKGNASGPTKRAVLSVLAQATYGGSHEAFFENARELLAEEQNIDTVGTSIRRCIYNTLEKDPPEWAKQHSITMSKEVYKGNASGPTKAEAEQSAKCVEEQAAKLIEEQFLADRAAGTAAEDEAADLIQEVADIVYDEPMQTNPILEGCSLNTYEWSSPSDVPDYFIKSNSPVRSKRKTVPEETPSSKSKKKEKTASSGKIQQTAVPRAYAAQPSSSNPPAGVDDRDQQIEELLRKKMKLYEENAELNYENTQLRRRNRHFSKSITKQSELISNILGSLSEIIDKVKPSPLKMDLTELRSLASSMGFGTRTTRSSDFEDLSSKVSMLDRRMKFYYARSEKMMNTWCFGYDELLKSIGGRLRTIEEALGRQTEGPSHDREDEV